MKAAFAEQIKSMQRLETMIEKTINDQLKQAGLLGELKRCLKVEGIGFLTGARLLTAFQRGNLATRMRLSPSWEWIYGYRNQGKRTVAAA
ncbi:hypothetical protein [Pseudomonas zeae]|uniref:Transposase IS116/IS110/IS902 family protein n=1 Tax=Pseudomonas zeae TaxID=2745510 RepID=A0ABU5BKP1_9PSED|nr:hypothetical protein [Pseudomonas zeae]MDX9677208.1 hypothetical protein [Pseudomonas zeae]